MKIIERNDLCAWNDQIEKLEGGYQTSCGHVFYFDSGDVGENGFDWCPYCGNQIIRNHC